MFYQLRNTYQATTDTLFQRTTGLLDHITDVRDLIFAGSSEYQKQHEEKSNICFEERFNQSPYTFCVFAAGTQASSHQNKIKFSERWAAKVARHFGYTTGQGLSYLRACKEIEIKYGFLPEEYMPGALNGMSWDEYSRWTDEDEKLLEIAAQFRAKKYERVSSLSHVYELLDQGRLLSTGGKWSRKMNNPQAPLYILDPSGDSVGAHAYTIFGYGKLNVLNTFGHYWGKDGLAKDTDLFDNSNYAIYTIEPLSIESHWFYIAKTLEGKAVKGRETNEIYYIENGKKYHIKEWETFVKDFNSFTLVSDEALALVSNGGVYNS